MEKTIQEEVGMIEHAEDKKKRFEAKYGPERLSKRSPLSIIIVTIIIIGIILFIFL